MEHKKVLGCTYQYKDFENRIHPMIHGFIISALVVIVALLVEMAMGIV